MTHCHVFKWVFFFKGFLQQHRSSTAVRTPSALLRFSRPCWVLCHSPSPNVPRNWGTERMRFFSSDADILKLLPDQCEVFTSTEANEKWRLHGWGTDFTEKRTADFFRLQGSVTTWWMMCCWSDVHCHLTGCANMASGHVPCWHPSLIVYRAKMSTGHVFGLRCLVDRLHICWKWISNVAQIRIGNLFRNQGKYKLYIWSAEQINLNCLNQV